ncbi:MAG TPA: nucleotide exchange factor GrpE [bacterium]|jgi:molecular chaperone GrpE
MRNFPVDFSDDQPLDIPWPDEIKNERLMLQGLDDIDLGELLKEISKIRLEVVKSARKRPDATQPLSEEKGIRFLTTAINELRRLQPEIAALQEIVVENTREEFLEDLFPTIDAFDRFFESVKYVTDPRAIRYIEGIKAIYSSVMQILRNNDVKEIPAHGTFNPKYQTAFGTEVRNDIPPNTIIRVERRGFIKGKKILRTPDVIISLRDDLVGE